MTKLRIANRQQAKLKLGIFGPSGSGKTYSSLQLAKGLANGNWEKVCIIDTENGSADLYSHFGKYNVLSLAPPFTPEAYIEAIKECEKACMEVIIIDSISHEWEGQGGILEILDELGKSAKNSFTIWSKLTPRHKTFIDKIIQCNSHVICCGRTKQDYVLNEIEKNGRTIKVPQKVGLKITTREGFDYEMTIAFDIAVNHYASVSKDRTELFSEEPEFKISEKTGEKILKWNLSGEKVVTIEEKQQIKFTEYFEKVTKSKTLEKLNLIAEEFKEEISKNSKLINKLQLEELGEIIQNMKKGFNEKKDETKQVEKKDEKKIIKKGKISKLKQK